MTGQKAVDVFAKIKGLKYVPSLGKRLETYDFDELDVALSADATFLLQMDNENQLAVSWWVSPKRTRSYPYARVYDSLDFAGRRITIIPAVKDEGKGGDRDFLQWDTVSLMSLLDVYVVISYYVSAEINPRYPNKVTNQVFDLDHIKAEIREISLSQSDALHWNLSQAAGYGKIAQRALDAYDEMSHALGVEMHSRESAKRKIELVLEGTKAFMESSRNRAMAAQKRESITKQPKEKLVVANAKATITIKNNLGGLYYFTCDEVTEHEKDLYLVEEKHSESSAIPKVGDIKDGLIKMILFTNLRNVRIGKRFFTPVPGLRLTGDGCSPLTDAEKETLRLLKKESSENGFRIFMEKEPPVE